jgi:hypothetical protein
MAILRPFRYGAPFLLGNSTPILLAGAAKAPPNDTEGDYALVTARKSRNASAAPA